jgi:hypothetical protein
MSSAAQDIVDEVITLLTVPPLDSVPAARVYRDIVDARRATQMPCLVVEAGDEDTPDRILIGILGRRLQVEITVLAKGVAPYAQADAALVESHNRLLGAQTVAGLWLNGLAEDITEGPTRRLRDGMAEDLAAITKTYVIAYRTAERSIERL